MKFVPLVWAGIWRRPVRSVLTAVCILVAFVLLGLLEGVNAGFARTIESAHRDILATRTRVRGGAPMPIAAMARIKSIPGVKEVAARAYFVGHYLDLTEKNTLAAIATQPATFFEVQPFLHVDPADLDALRKNRSGILVTPTMLQTHGWKVGQSLTVSSDLQKTDGSKDWTFNIVGTFDTPPGAGPAFFGVINYDYFDGYRASNQGTAEMFYVRITNPNHAIAMSAAIDRIFANSPNETRTLSQQARAEAQAKQMGDVELFTDAIIGAVLFTLAFVTGNTLRESLEQRAREFALLKATGYSDARVLGLAYAEALVLYLPPAALGLLISRLLAPLAREDIGSVVVSSGVAAAGLLCAGGLALLGVALPASNLARMQIATALGRA